QRRGSVGDDGQFEFRESVQAGSFLHVEGIGARFGRCLPFLRCAGGGRKRQSLQRKPERGDRSDAGGFGGGIDREGRAHHAAVLPIRKRKPDFDRRIAGRVGRESVSRFDSRIENRNAAESGFGGGKGGA